MKKAIVGLLTSMLVLSLTISVPQPKKPDPNAIAKIHEQASQLSGKIHQMLDGLFNGAFFD